MSRAAWEFAHGDIPAGMFVYHRCDNPARMNPAHLFLGTPADNMRDMARKGRVKGVPRRGESHAHARATEAIVIDIRRRHASGERIADLARLHGLGWTTTRCIAYGKTWRHVQ